MVEDADWQVYFSERSAALSFFNIKIMINNIGLLSIVFNYILLKALEAGMFDESTKLCDIKYKIVFLGQSSVGKSAIIERFIQNRYDPNKLETVGIDFLVKNVHYQGRVYRLQLWDTAGQQKFKSLVPNYIKDAHCAVLAYDISNKQSFEGVNSWLELFKNHNKTQAVCILVGNKSDLKEREVSELEGQRKAEECSLSFCETSAKTSHGIEQLFHSIIQNINVHSQTQHPNQNPNHPPPPLPNTSNSQTRINKTKIVKISKQKRQAACCYI